jgi:hypothetical protein
MTAAPPQSIVFEPEGSHDAKMPRRSEADAAADIMGYHWRATKTQCDCSNETA